MDIDIRTDVVRTEVVRRTYGCRTDARACGRRLSCDVRGACKAAPINVVKVVDKRL